MRLLWFFYHIVLRKYLRLLLINLLALSGCVLTIKVAVLLWPTEEAARTPIAIIISTLLILTVNRISGVSPTFPLRQIAIHEAAHAVVAWSEPTIKIRYVHASKVGGFFEGKRIDDGKGLDLFIRAAMRVCVASIVAETRLLGHPTTGCSSDFFMATLQAVVVARGNPCKAYTFFLDRLTEAGEQVTKEWGRIETLADALERNRHGKLRYRALRRILGRRA